MAWVGGRHGAGAACVIALVLLRPGGSRADGGVDYRREIAPLLGRACVRCHGAGRSAGGLRLDQRDGLARVIQAGAGDASALVRRLRGQGDEPRMPKDAPALAPAAIARISRWIDEGAAGLPPAAWPPIAVRDHWAYQPPRRPALPRVRHTTWPRGPIDRFVLAALEPAGLSPAPPADRATLLRRVTLDLTGLPPSLAELDAFLADTRADAYERVVERLLASPHFGERWAVPWLDAARYADSNGYEKDNRRPIWKYRDWVVGALNDDLPFDRFTELQLAGDLAPGGNTAARIATGFHRNTMFNEEAGVDPAEAHWERLVDRAGTTATVWLGSTLGCAQCHDHKHDPFSQRDFYRLLAFFEDAAEVTVALPSAAQAATLAAQDRAIARLQATMGRWTPALGEAQRRWEAELGALPQRWHILVPERLQALGAGTLVPEADGAVLVTGAGTAPAAHVIEASVPGGGFSALRLEALPDPRLPAGGPGRAPTGGFLLSGVEIATASATTTDGVFMPVRLGAARSDDRPREEPERYGAETLVTPPGGENSGPRGWGVAALYDAPARLPRQLVVVPVTPVRVAPGARLRVRITLRYDRGSAGEVIGRFRLSTTAAPDPSAIVAVSAALRRVALLPASQRTQQEGNDLAQAFREISPLLAPERAALARLQAARAAAAAQIPRTLALGPRALGPGTPARTPLRLGGSFARPDQWVEAGLPAALAAAGPQVPPARNRLELSRWLTSADNPLTARVAVNRLWASYFGRGLVETVEDFGTQGARPSHPALLDWLATELVRSGWHWKPLHRLIVTSAVYRQTSVPGPRARLRDPDNRLLSRAPRLRLEAEMVRDVALAASGLLDDRLGGPPVFPPQPAVGPILPNSTEPVWAESAGSEAHRRALYTFWRRTAPYPTAALFDAPSREICTVRRARSETALQALATLNDPVFWRAAVALADRMGREPPAAAPLAERLGHGFRLVTGRLPLPGERAALARLYRAQQARLAREQPTTTPAERARQALALVANVMLNLDETLTRG